MTQEGGKEAGGWGRRSFSNEDDSCDDIWFLHSVCSMECSKVTGFNTSWKGVPPLIGVSMTACQVQSGYFAVEQVTLINIFFSAKITRIILPGYLPVELKGEVLS